MVAFRGIGEWSAEWAWCGGLAGGGSDAVDDVLFACGTTYVRTQFVRIEKSELSHERASRRENCRTNEGDLHLLFQIEKCSFYVPALF